VLEWTVVGWSCNKANKTAFKGSLTILKYKHIKEEVMSVGRFVGEALGEVAFLNVLSSAWDWAKGLLTGTIGDEVKTKVHEHLFGGHEWKDEHWLAMDLAEANISIAQKKMLEQAMLFAQQADDANGTTYASNFRFIVALHDEKEVVPPAVRPGITILEDLAATCNNSVEVFTRIVALGVMQDASTSLEKFLKFGKDVILPFLKAKGIGMHASADAVVVKLETAVRNRNDEFEKRPLWKKIFQN
jgi:hypothetical protein